jgi:GTPase SAR1 family protein
MAEATPALKMLLLGEAGVGKTALYLRYTEVCFSCCLRIVPLIQPQNIWNDAPPAMSYDSVKVSEVIDGRKVILSVQDTAGFEVYRSLTNSHYRGADAALFLADVASKDSLEKLSNWIADAKVLSEAARFGSSDSSLFLACRTSVPPALSFCWCSARLTLKRSDRQASSLSLCPSNERYKR